MRLFHLFLAAATAAVAATASARPPREESPAPVDLLAGIAFDASDDEAVAAASAHPLGSLANPVRVGGPEGERAYMARLRCADGSAPRIGAQSAAGIGGFGPVTQAYALDCGAAAPGKIQLVLDRHPDEHREQQAPPGFALAR